MKKLKTKKETTINSIQLSMIRFIERYLNNKHNTQDGYVESIKFNSDYYDNIMVSNAELIYSIPVKIKHKTIASHNYFYKVTPSLNTKGKQSKYLTCIIEENNFTLVDENKEIYDNSIKELNEKLTA